jgi:hypothetical protein
MYDAYDALLKLPQWGIVVAVAIPASVILVLSARFALSRERSDRSNDNVYTAAARLAGVSIAILGAFCVVIVWQADSKWRATAELEFAYANAMIDHVSVMDPAEAQVLTASLHAYAVDALANEIERQPNASEDSVANREMKTMANVINTYADRQAVRTEKSMSLLRDFQNFQDQRAQRLTNPVDVLDPSIAMALAAVALVSLLIMGFYPAGPSTFGKWLQVATSGLVIIAIVSTPLALESPQFNKWANGEPMVAFLDRLDHVQR